MAISRGRGGYGETLENGRRATEPGVAAQSTEAWGRGGWDLRLAMD